MRKSALLLCALLWSGLASAGWDQARAAYKKGDYATAATEMIKLAKHGDAKAQVNLGSMYAEGQGLPRDNKKAEYWYLRAAEQGDVFGQTNLGDMYTQGVLRNDVQALKWYIVAAKSGDKYAIRSRDNLENRMAASQIKKARRLAQAWSSRHARKKR
jgi:uncharacterized protein